MNLLRDIRLVFGRQMRLMLRNPAWLIIGLIQPILYLALFGPLLKPVVKSGQFGNGTASQVFVPGLLVQLGLFGSLFVGFAIIAEWRAGVIERMRVTPVSRLALLLGRVLRDALAFMVQAVVLILVGTLVGLRAPIVGILIALLFAFLLAISMSSLSYTAGLTLKSEDALAPMLNTVALPLLLLSGIMLPITKQSAPSWLYWVSHANPFRYIVDAMRQVFLGHYGNGTVLAGLVIAVLLAAFSVNIGTQVFRTQNA
jgi:ABC-2 type transport system permease protein